LKVMTVLIEIPDDRTEEAFREMLDSLSDQVISADLETLTVRLRDERDHG